MELGEVLFYYRAAKKHYESIADAHRNANNAGKHVEAEAWAQRDEDGYDEDEDVSLDALVDE